MPTLLEKLKPRYGMLKLNGSDNLLSIIHGKLPEELTNDPEYNNITSLSFSNFNNLKTIDNLPEKILSVSIYDSRSIEEFANAPSSLGELVINNAKNLKSIDNLTQLSYLTIKNCPKLQLPNFETFQKLTQIVLDNVNITSLSSLPPKLNNFSLNNSNIERLPNLTIDSLKTISLTHNSSLEELPELPEFLESLICNNSKLKSLPNLPETLIKLEVQHNELTELPQLPNSLINLRVNNNKLTSLPSPFPRDLKNLNFSNNRITIVPEIPDTLEEINGTNNPITQLPEIPNVYPNIYIQFDDNIMPNINVQTSQDEELPSITDSPTGYRYIPTQPNPPEPPESMYIPNNEPRNYPPPPNYPPHSQYSLETNRPMKFKLTDMTYNVIENEEVSIQDYLNSPDAEEDQYFVLHLNGTYICQSLNGLKITNSERGRPTDYAEYYECDPEAPSHWAGNSYINTWLQENGRGPFVKIMGPGGTNYLVDKPSFFWNGPVPGSKVFNMVKIPEKVKKYVSSYMLPVRPGLNVLGADHCNQTAPETLYRLELMEIEKNKHNKRTKKQKKHRNRKTKKHSQRKREKNILLFK